MFPNSNKLSYDEYFKLSFKDRVTYHSMVESTRPLSVKEKEVSKQFHEFLDECKRRYNNNEIVI